MLVLIEDMQIVHSSIEESPIFPISSERTVVLGNHFPGIFLPIPTPAQIAK